MTETFTVEIDSELLDADDVEDALVRGSIKRERINVTETDSKEDRNVE